VQVLVLEDASHGGPICDDVTLAMLQDQMPDCQGYLAVGSGVVNDLTKWLSFERQSFYAVAATAATMNGYSAANVAATLKGVKSLVVAHAPVAVFAEPWVLEQAPYELTSAGLGDVIAKPISTADWLMNHYLLEEYYCPFCAELITEIEPLYFNCPESILAGDRQAIEALFSGLFYSGIAMTMVGTSAPASGGEHMLSHTLDMMSMVDGQKHDLHGRQVGVGVIFAAALYERLFAINEFKAYTLPDTIDGGFWKHLAEPVGAQYRMKQPLMARISDAAAHDSRAWQRFLEQARDTVRGPAEIKACLEKAGAAATFAALGCSRERFLDAVLHMHEIRKRPTIVDLAWLVGILPGAAQDITEQWLTA
jgi:glycerol-1-phosphate dehydrogenase [NAD(P)+]